MESGILGFGIQNTAQGILYPTNDRNPESRFQDKDWNPAPEIRIPRRGAAVRAFYPHSVKNLMPSSCCNDSGTHSRI